MGKGGQRRTIQAECGWRCVGHPQEVDGKFRIHKRFCKTCVESQTELPAFNKAAGLINGWKGLTEKKQKPDEILTTIVGGDRVNDILIRGVNNVESALDGARIYRDVISK